MPVVQPIVTPVQDPHIIHSDDDGGWKLVTRKSKEVDRRVVYAPRSCNVFHTLASSTAEDGPQACFYWA